MLLPKFAYAKENLVLKGYWFECEFSGKTVPPKDQCEMLDDDGFNFKGNVAINVKNISSKETKCKKKKDWTMFSIKYKIYKCYSWQIRSSQVSRFKFNFKFFRL